MSLLSNISGLTGENVSTEILVHLLSSRDNFIPFQKLFFLRIFGVPTPAKHLNLEITSQRSFLLGRPDFICLTNDALLIFENKLGSFLSGDDQLIRYARLFENLKEFAPYFPFLDVESIKTKYLILISPNSIIEVAKIKTDEKSKRDYGIDFASFCNERDIIFKCISWEEILFDLDLNDSLQFELNEFVSSFVSQKLSEVEIMLLKDKNIPIALSKLFNEVSAIKSTFSLEGFKLSKVSQSYNYLGFFLQHQDLDLWFGYFFRLWQNYETAIFLQIKKGWIKSRNDEIDRVIQKIGFINDPTEGHVLPFEMSSIEKWKEQLENILKELTDTALNKKNEQ